MNIVAMDREGKPGGASSQVGKTYVFMREDMSEPEEVERIHVEVEGVSSNLD